MLARSYLSAYCAFSSFRGSTVVVEATGIDTMAFGFYKAWSRVASRFSTVPSPGAKLSLISLAAAGISTCAGASALIGFNYTIRSALVYFSLCF